MLAFHFWDGAARIVKQDPRADATLTLTRATLDEINLDQTPFEKAIASGAIEVKGNKQKVADLFSWIFSAC